MSSLRNRMYNHEVNPPANTWEKIAAALDDAALQNKFPTRLYNMETAPPAAVWERVSKNLESDTGKITPVRKLVPYSRYAAAAVLIVVVAYSISRFAFNKDAGENYSATTLPAKTTDTGNTKPADTGNAIAIETIVPEEEDIAPVGRIESRTEHIVRKTNRNLAHTAVVQNTELDNDLSQSIYAYADHVPDIADRYVMLMTPDGKLIRMSKKWSDLLCCVSGEEQGPDCKNQLKKWQEKIAGSSLAPSPGNFMDILGLVNSLDDSNGL